MPHRRPSTTVCILTMNRVETLRESVDALLPGLDNAPGLGDLLILDQASRDATGDYLAGLKQRLADRLTIISSPVNIGCAGGRLALVEYLMAEGLSPSHHVVFLDDDVVATSADWVGALTEPIARGTAEITGVDGFKITSEYYTAPAADYDYFGGGRCAVQGRVFLSGCLFDTRFNPKFWEDVDLCLQAREKQFRLCEVPNMGLAHKEYGEGVEMFMKTRQLFMEKWPQERLAAVRGRAVPAGHAAKGG